MIKDKTCDDVAPSVVSACPLVYSHVPGCRNRGKQVGKSVRILTDFHQWIDECTVCFLMGNLSPASIYIYSVMHERGIERTI